MPFLKRRDTDATVDGNRDDIFIAYGLRYATDADGTHEFALDTVVRMTVYDATAADAQTALDACFVLGEQKARDLVAQFPDTDVIFIYEDGRIS